MKFKFAVFALCFSILSFAQTSNQSKPDSTKSQASTVAQSETKTECPCCKAMADSKDAKSCCHHDATASKEGVGCCGGKDGTSCMKNDKAKSADATSGSCCGGTDQKGCCAKSDKAPEQTAMACCGGSGGHCGAQHHEHGDVNK